VNQETEEIIDWLRSPAGRIWSKVTFTEVHGEFFSLKTDVELKPCDDSQCRWLGAWHPDNSVVDFYENIGVSIDLDPDLGPEYTSPPELRNRE
jgi:hypothetical protein